MAIDPAAIHRDIEALEREILEKKKALGVLKKRLPAEIVPDLQLHGADGAPVRLSELFGDQDDLLVIHNMGSRCPYCSLWADGFNGLVKQLESRCAFVVVSPDEPSTQRAIARERGWHFRMASSHASDFTRKLGFEEEDGSETPGVSAFHKAADGTLTRTGTAVFGPGDDFCSAWPLFELLPQRPWHPLQS